MADEIPLPPRRFRRATPPTRIPTSPDVELERQKRLREWSWQHTPRAQRIKEMGVIPRPIASPDTIMRRRERARMNQPAQRLGAKIRRALDTIRFGDPPLPWRGWGETPGYQEGPIYDTYWRDDVDLLEGQNRPRGWFPPNYIPRLAIREDPELAKLTIEQRLALQGWTSVEQRMALLEAMLPPAPEPEGVEPYDKQRATFAQRYVPSDRTIEGRISPKADIGTVRRGDVPDVPVVSQPTRELDPEQLKEFEEYTDEGFQAVYGSGYDPKLGMRNFPDTVPSGVFGEIQTFDLPSGTFAVGGHYAEKDLFENVFGLDPIQRHSKQSIGFLRAREARGETVPIYAETVAWAIPTIAKNLEYIWKGIKATAANPRIAMLNPNLSFEMEQEAEAALADAERDAGTRFSDEDREAFKVGEIERILEERGEGWVDHYEREQTLAALAEEIGELQAEFSTSLHKEHGEYVEAYTEGTLTAKENAQAWKDYVSSWWNKTPEWNKARHFSWTWQDNQAAYFAYQQDVIQLHEQLGRPLTYAEIDALKERHEELGTELVGDIIVDWLNVPGVSAIWGGVVKTGLVVTGKAVKAVASPLLRGTGKGVAALVGTLPVVAKQSVANTLKNEYSDIARILIDKTGAPTLQDAVKTYIHNPKLIPLNPKQHNMVTDISTKIFDTRWERAEGLRPDIYGLAAHADSAGRDPQVIEFLATRPKDLESAEFIRRKIIGDKFGQVIADEWLRKQGVGVNGFKYVQKDGVYQLEKVTSKAAHGAALASKLMAYWVEAVLLPRPAFYIRNLIDSTGRLVLETGSTNMLISDVIKGHVPGSVMAGYSSDFLKGGGADVVARGKVPSPDYFLQDVVHAMQAYGDGGSPYADFVVWAGGRGGGKEGLAKWQVRLAESVKLPRARLPDERYVDYLGAQALNRTKAVVAALVTGVIPNIFETMSKWSGAMETSLRMKGFKMLYNEKMQWLNNRYKLQILSRVPIFREDPELFRQAWGIWVAASDSPEELVRLTQEVVAGKRGVIWPEVYDFLHRAHVQPDDIDAFAVKIERALAERVTADMTQDEFLRIVREVVEEMRDLVHENINHFSEAMEPAAARVDEAIDVIIDDMKLGGETWRGVVGEPLPARRPGVLSVLTTHDIDPIEQKLMDKLGVAIKELQGQDWAGYAEAQQINALRIRLFQFFREVFPGPYRGGGLEPDVLKIAHEQYRAMVLRTYEALWDVAEGALAAREVGTEALEAYMANVNTRTILERMGGELLDDGVIFRGILNERHIYRLSSVDSPELIREARALLIEGENFRALQEGYEAILPEGTAQFRIGIGELDAGIMTEESIYGKFLFADINTRNYEAALGGIRLPDFLLPAGVVDDLIHEGTFLERWLREINIVARETGLGPARGYVMHDIIPAHLAEAAWDALSEAHKLSFKPRLNVAVFAQPIEGLSAGVMQTMLYADNVRGSYLAALTHWENYLAQLDEVPITVEKGAALLEWAQTVGRDHKAYLAAAAAQGGAKAGPHAVLEGVVAGLEGAADQITKAMVNYSHKYAAEGSVRYIFPFWTFPTRSLPWWIAYLTMHPTMVKHYNHFEKASRMLAYAYDATDSRGRPLRRLRGHIPVPFTDEWWFNPLAPFSFMAVLGVQPADFREFDDLPPLQKMVQYFMTYAPAVGFYPAPMWVPALTKLGWGDTNAHPQRGVIGVFDMIGPAAKRQIAEFATNTNMLGRLTPSDFSPWLWSQEVPWQNYVITRRVLSLTAERATDTLSEVERDALETAFKEALIYAGAAQNIMDVLLANLPAGAPKPTVGDIRIALAELEKVYPAGAALWLQARDEIEKEQGTARNLSFTIGFSAKRFAANEAELYRIRDADRALARQVLESLDIEAKYRDWMYDTLKGQLARAYRDISWVVNEHGERVYGAEWMQEVADRTRKSLDTGEYWQTYGQIWQAREKELASLPVGATYDSRKSIYDFWNDVTKGLNAAYPEIRREWSPYNKSMETVQERIIHEFVSLIEHSQPGYMPDDETWDEYQLRVIEFEDQQLDEVAGRAWIQMNNSHADNPLMMDALATFGDYGQQLRAYSSPEAREAYHRQYDDGLDALNKAWKEMYWEPYWEAVEGSSSYTRSLEEFIFMEQYGGPARPTNQQLVDWVMEQYPERFDEQELLESIDDGEILTVQERLGEGKSEIWGQSQEIWDIVTRAGPKKDKLLAKLDYPTQGSLNNTWWDTAGDLSAWHDPEEAQRFYNKIVAAAAELEAEGELPAELSREELEEFSQAYEDYQRFKQMRDLMFNVPENGYFDLYALSDLERENYNNSRANFADLNPAFKKYYYD